MRCQYRFSVTGKLRLPNAIEIVTTDGVIQLETSATGVVTELIVTVPVAPDDAIPTMTPVNAGPAKFHINVPSLGSAALRARIRTMEGLLSLYGVRGIDLEHFQRRWIAESAEEEARLDIRSFTASRVSVPDSELPLTPVDVVARAVLVSPDALELEIPLNFFRRGQLDMVEERYIEAFYDFFFVLETLYGGGKSKTAALAAEFKTSADLTQAILASTNDPALRVEFVSDPLAADAFRSRYSNATPDSVIDHLVSTRGLLHHHSLKNPRKWHPDESKRFIVDSTVLQRIAFQVVWDLHARHVFSPAAEALLHSARIRISEPATPVSSGG